MLPEILAKTTQMPVTGAADGQRVEPDHVYVSLPDGLLDIDDGVLRENPHELDRLFSELLISVTSFFRDPEAFDTLAEHALPPLLRERDKSATLRAWVAGCASGEEAYTVAIVLDEVMRRGGHRLDVQIFATDLDATAIDGARAGIYADGIAADVGAERLDRYFTQEDDVYRVRKDLREQIIFANQNAIKDPPFTRLDLIVCRNLLIYLDSNAQKRLLPTFHYALRPGGILFLGPSETIADHGDLFETIDARWKIFRRRETARAVHPALTLPHLGFDRRNRPDDGDKTEAASPATHIQVRRLLLERFAPPTVVCDNRGTIVFIQGRTGRYLEPAEGSPTHNIFDMARHGLGPALTSALRQADRDKRDIVREGVSVRTNGDTERIDIRVSPINEPESLVGLFLVSFHVTPPAPDPPGPDETADEDGDRARELERELQYNKESLQTTVEELETSNEELQSTNEELQSTNEELETSKPGFPRYRIEE
jgi:two-component system CheB/CheR fusion protein